MAHSGLHVDLRCTAPVPLQAQFDCAPGELVALVGPSGSGKTTLLRAIAGLYTSPHLQGSVSLGQGDGADRWFDSQRGVNLAPQARRAGLVFQQYALFPHLNAIDNVALCLYSTSGKALKNRQAMALLERVDLKSLAHRLPHQLSGGQQQRVAIARALARLLPQQSGAHNDEKVAALPAVQRGVLLLDEPFSAVDAPTRQLLYRSVAQLHATLALPIILVTHDLAEARRLADRVVIIDSGGVTLQSGPPERVLRSPRNARVAQLVGIHNHFAGQFYGSAQPALLPDTPAVAPPHALGQLHWGAHRLHAPDKGRIDSGTDVTWVLAGDSVQLLAADKGGAEGVAGVEEANSENTAADNYLACQLTEMLPLGEMCVCQLTVPGAPAGDAISLNMSTALLRSLGAQVGCALRLHIPPEALHIMPVREV